MELEYIKPVEVDGGIMYRKLVDLDGFLEWYNDVKKRERGLTRREWYIAIVSSLISATIGALLGLIAFFCSL